MKATIVISASNLNEAREKAIQSFESFFGETPFVCGPGEATPEVSILRSGKVVSWACEFTAEEAP